MESQPQISVLAVNNPRWLIAVRFSNKDQSIYITPLYDQEYTVLSLSEEEKRSFRHRPGADFHLSLHESGIVNLTTSDEGARLRKQVSAGRDVRHVVTFQINSIEHLPETTLEEVNRPKDGHLYLAIPAFVPLAPMMLSVFCAKDSAGWQPPGMGNIIQVDYKTRLKGKDYSFHFVQWQDLRMKRGETDIALQFGGKDDRFFGV